MENQRKETAAFTLIELFAVLAITAVLAVMLLPALARAKARNQRANCASNLKELGISFRTWASHNNDAYPMIVPPASGGPPNQTQITNGAAQYLYQVFGVMSNEVGTARLLACPSDSDTTVHTNLLIVTNAVKDVAVPGSGSPPQYSLCDYNVSYFLGLDADENFPQMLLCGDRNIYGGTGSYARMAAAANNRYGDAQHGSPAEVVFGTNFVATASSPGWTGKIHRFQGNVLLCDGSVEQFYSSARLRDQFLNSGDRTQTPGPNTLLFP
jgi:prepilin-type processing-associated H-X9-DG protein